MNLETEKPRTPASEPASLALAREMRKTIVEVAAKAGTGHISSALSMVDILAVLYHSVLPKDRRSLVLSKGHGALALYSALYHAGHLSREDLDSYHRDGTRMTTFPAEPFFPSVVFSSGSLGHGAGVAAGTALAYKKQGDKPVFAILSDGECQEGSTWEAALFASHHRLDNLTFIVDCNGLQAFGATADVLDLEPFTDKWKSFGFETVRVDGHDHAALELALNARGTRGPKCIIADTTKGKGISFMEGSLEWHYLPITGDWSSRAHTDVGHA